ncbi:MAG: SPOR domain-containing protein [Gammaproteobacteria bacterium]|nr:SPOR domain-containing protein [Gammaproteobacteria bacterium]
MAGEKSSSPWVWVFLFLMLGFFAAFIIFLDQKLVGTSVSKPVEKQNQDRTKPTIDFYSVLPDRKVEIPVSEEEKQAIENPTINKTAGDQVLLQVGSFQNPEDAERLKAELAFLGLEAKVKAAEVNDDTWHRVQIGPFASNTALSRAQNLLLENKIKYVQRKLPQ